MAFCDFLMCFGRAKFRADEIRGAQFRLPEIGKNELLFVMLLGQINFFNIIVSQCVNNRPQQYTVPQEGDEDFTVFASLFL